MNDDCNKQKQFDTIYRIGIITGRNMGLAEQELEECAFSFLEKVFLMRQFLTAIFLTICILLHG